MGDRVGQQLGHYRLIKRLGMGTFAEVYLAEHLFLKQAVAVKTLRLTQPSAEEIEQLRIEAEQTSKLKHPHIVPVHDFGIGENGEPYLVMDYAPSTLRELFPLGEVQTPEAILPTLKQIAVALDYAHKQQHVLHLDVKPSNILVGMDGNILIADFGLAEVLNFAQTHKTLEGFAGTAKYAAPEQFDNYKPCPESDQYAVGVMVYQWLTGELPFTGNDAAVGAQKLHRPPAPLHTIVASIPAPLENAILMALRTDPKARFRSVGAFVRAIETSMTTEPLAVLVAGSPEADPATVSSASTRPEGLNGRDLVDEHALPAWLRAMN